MVGIHEVALLACAEPGDRRLRVRAEGALQLSDGPDVELTLDALGVGVERRVEATLLAAHLAQRPGERVEADVQQTALAERLEAVQICASEQRVVVEHLLEMRHRPRVIDAVAGEAAADLVVDAAARHREQRRQRHRALVAQQQELDHRRLRELRRSAKAAVARVEGLCQRRHGGVQLLSIDRLGGGVQPRAAGEALA